MRIILFYNTKKRRLGWSNGQDSFTYNETLVSGMVEESGVSGDNQRSLISDMSATDTNLSSTSYDKV